MIKFIGFKSPLPKIGKMCKLSYDMYMEFLSGDSDDYNKQKFLLQNYTNLTILYECVVKKHFIVDWYFVKSSYNNCYFGIHKVWKKFKKSVEGKYDE